MTTERMSNTLEYTEAEAEREEAAYETPGAAERRELVRKNLDLRNGEEVLSIGCGPGFEPAGLAGVVGEAGHVHGIDRSEAMLALARRRCAELPHVTLTKADATDVPVSDESVDAAVAVQLYEYVEDLEAALDELHRVLRIGGRAVVYDTDFDSLVWHSSDRERTERVLEAFEDHCPRPHLGSRLSPHLRDAGLTVERVEPNSILNTRLDEDTFAYHLAQGIRDYVVDRGVIEQEVAEAWIDDLRERDEMGETFFNLTQYLYVVRKQG